MLPNIEIVLSSGFHRFQREIVEPQQVVTSNSGISCSLRCRSRLAHWRSPVECLNPVSLWLVSSGFVGGVVIVFFVVVVVVVVAIGIRHLRGFWFSRELRGDQGEAGALAEGRPGVDGLGTVGRQHSSIFPNAACDGQTGLVPHGFCKC